MGWAWRGRLVVLKVDGIGQETSCIRGIEDVYLLVKRKRNKQAVCKLGEEMVDYLQRNDMCSHVGRWAGVVAPR